MKAIQPYLTGASTATRGEAVQIPRVPQIRDRCPAGFFRGLFRHLRTRARAREEVEMRVIDSTGSTLPRRPPGAWGTAWRGVAETLEKHGDGVRLARWARDIAELDGPVDEGQVSADLRALDDSELAMARDVLAALAVIGDLRDIPELDAFAAHARQLAVVELARRGGGVMRSPRWP